MIKRTFTLQERNDPDENHEFSIVTYNDDHEGYVAYIRKTDEDVSIICPLTYEEFDFLREVIS